LWSKNGLFAQVADEVKRHKKLGRVKLRTKTHELLAEASVRATVGVSVVYSVAVARLTPLPGAVFVQAQLPKTFLLPLDGRWEASGIIVEEVSQSVLRSLKNVAPLGLHHLGRAVHY